ncbi:hypothetical protein C1I94_07625 [Akkermansia muciniphila]|jgi:hypothetical protein|nr:hypothetical protein CUC06_07035 [Akkermansia muciniphila]PNC70282.1 hypothetical protein CXU04_10005 [Akkermansia muciniphila]PNC82240.1 hypothetical protein CXU01_02550 [Akkermansia muciniphila]QAA41470.1 hypothetical protein C1I94_07625 [Akkermansia muciniphila]QAA43772.1 hypothetical protein C1I96_07325 [Akkermansia muciniphila]
MKQKTRHFTNSRPTLFPTITAHPFLYSVPLLPPISPLPPENHRNRKTVYASSRKRMGAEEVLFLKK